MFHFWTSKVTCAFLLQDYNIGIIKLNNFKLEK